MTFRIFFTFVCSFLLTSIAEASADERKPVLVLGFSVVLGNGGDQSSPFPEGDFPKKYFTIPDEQRSRVYVVPAYLPEFMKFVRDKFEINFFGLSTPERCQELFGYMWEKVFGEKIPENICILSSNDAIDVSRNLNFYPEMHPMVGGQRWGGIYKKDISKLGPLESTILLDDDISVIMSGQVKNLLKLPYLLPIHLLYTYKQTKERGLGFDHLKIFYRLVYGAGILKLALDSSEKNQTPIVDELYEIQFKNGEPQFNELLDDLEIYRVGFEVLSQYAEPEGLPEYFPAVEERMRPTEEYVEDYISNIGDQDIERIWLHRILEGLSNNSFLSFRSYPPYFALIMQMYLKSDLVLR